LGHDGSSRREDKACEGTETQLCFAELGIAPQVAEKTKPVKALKHHIRDIETGWCRFVAEKTKPVKALKHSNSLLTTFASVMSQRRQSL